MPAGRDFLSLPGAGVVPSQEQDMPDQEPSVLPPPSPDQRRIVAAQFERANQVIASGNHDYGIQLLLSCCKLDAANLGFRQALRRAQKAKYKNNLRGSRLAVFSTAPAKARLKAAKQGRNYLKVLEHGEEILVSNPWDVGTQMDMAEAADALGLLDMAVWILEQARQKDPNLVPLNRALARLDEKRGTFTQAIACWELVRKAAPADIEANHQAKDLAASETIARGNYEEGMGGSSLANSGAAPGTPGGPPADPLTREAAALERRIDDQPTRAGNYIQLAALYRRERLHDQAREALERGRAATGNDFQIIVEIAEMELEPFRQNLTLAEQQLKADPQNDEKRKLRVRLLKEINSRELELFRLKADRFPTELAHRLELGIRLLKGGQLDEAIKELQLARADNRLTWKALWYLGHCFKNRNNWRLARRNFEEALQGVPQGEDGPRKEILFQLASGCAEAGELATAVDLGHELANIDFSYRDIGRLLDEWQTKLQQA
jgi:tetratricopeptide (TPR) repeat protein